MESPITEKFLVKTWNEYVDMYQKEGYLALISLRDEMGKRINENPRYGQVVNRLRILDTAIEQYERFGEIKGLPNEIKKSFSYKGKLSDQCIDDLEALAEEYPDLPINEFFKTAYNQKESCRKAIKDGEPIKISWAKLRDEVKRMNRQDIYYREKKRRKQ
jgi:hypothetical protein